MADAIASLVDILKSNWNKPPQPSIEDIADLDKGDAKRVRMLDKDVIRIFETAHNEAQPELLYDFVNQHVNLTIDIRSVKTRERLSELRDETRRILHAFRKGDGINFDRIIFKTRTDLSDRSKKLFRYTLQCEVVTFTLDATGDGGAVVNPATGAVTVGQSQAYDTDLTALATLSHSDGAFIVSDGTTWVAESGATARTSLGLGSLATESTIDTTDIADSALITSSESFADSDTAIMTAAAIEDKILSYGYTTETGDITGVTAGTGLSGGGTSGDVTLNVDTSTIATKTYVDTSVTNLVDGAPGVLDTLNELAAALGDDANFANTVLLKSDNLSSLTSASTARTNLGLGDLATQSLANGGDNRIITSTSSSTLNAEATLTYDGAKLEINNGAGEVIGIGGGGAGYQSIEIGGDTGAYIDLKSPNSDDYDLRIISTGSGGTIQTSSPLTFQTGSDNSDITLSPHGTGNVQVNADLVVTGDLSVSGGYGLSASDIPNLAASKITSGTFADALIAASNVTQHQSSLSITESQISDLQSYLTAPRTVTAGGNTLANGETLAFTAGSNVTITEVGGAVTIASTDTNTQLTLLDEDDMSSNSATAAASQQSIKAYVDAEIADLVDSAPGTLDTLGELATALQANDNDITTITTALGNRLRIDVNTQGLTSTQQANGLTNLGITASLAEINILDGGLSASDIPSLATSKITSGTFADARIAESNVTQHQAALSITESQISDLQSYLTAPRTVTAGGNTLASGETLAFTAGSNVTITELNGAVTIASTDTNTNQLTTFTLAGDSGSSQTIGQGDTLKVAGGSAI
ncbi:MAG: beta strand repeat-containing protein, partial [Candidatus Thalassarchaeaceae archaeon]